MKCEIDIDLGALADEWEPVAFRKPTDGDSFIGNDGEFFGPDRPVEMRFGPRLIVRSRWQWPEWLTAEWIARDYNGTWWAYAAEPRLDERYPDSWTGSLGKRTVMFSELFAFSPPQCGDWRQSKRRNPNAKATT